MLTKSKLLTFFIAIYCFQTSSPMNFARRAKPLARSLARTSLSKSTVATRTLLNKRLFSTTTESRNSKIYKKLFSFEYDVHAERDNQYIIKRIDYLFIDLLKSYNTLKIAYDKSECSNEYEFPKKLLDLRYNIYLHRNICIDVLKQITKQNLLENCGSFYIYEILYFFKVFTNILEHAIKTGDKILINTMLEWALDANNSIINPKIAHEYIEKNEIESLIKLISDYLNIEANSNYANFVKKSQCFHTKKQKNNLPENNL